MSDNRDTASRRRGPMGGPMGMMGAPAQKPKDFKGAIKKLVLHLAHYKFRLLVVAVFSIASMIFSIVGPKILGRATNTLVEGIMGKINGTGSGIDFAKIGQILILLLLLYVASFLFTYIQGWIMTGVSMKVTYNLRNDVASKINRLPLSYFDRTSHGEVLSRITNDVDLLSQTLNQSVTQIITSVTLIVGIIAMMFSISWLMTLVSLIILPMSLAIVTMLIKRSQKHFAAQQEYLGHLNGHVEEMYGGHIVIKAFNREKASVDTFDSYNDELYSSAWKSQFYAGLMMPVMHFVSNLGYVAVCILGGWLAIR